MSNKTKTTLLIDPDVLAFEASIVAMHITMEGRTMDCTR